MKIGPNLWPLIRWIGKALREFARLVYEVQTELAGAFHEDDAAKHPTGNRGTH